MYRQSNIDIELGLQVGVNIGVGILHDVLSPGFALKRSNPKLIDALKEIERRVNETLRRHAFNPENPVIQYVGRPPIEHNPVATAPCERIMNPTRCSGSVRSASISWGSINIFALARYSRYSRESWSR